jgi:hypothetical protein
MMHSLQILDCPWSCIGINFVFKLPISLGFDFLVIVDHFSKGIHLILANETWMAKEFGVWFVDCFIRLHGLPDKIVCNRGSLLVSKFWQEVQRLLKITAAPSTAWHPRTDGQTECANQAVKIFLQHFVSDRQENWLELLPLAELVYNSSLSTSTDFSPFFSQYAFHPQTNMFNKGSQVPVAEELLGKLVSVQETLVDNVQKAKETQKKYFDKNAREVPTYWAGDWVWLLRQNIYSTHPLSKLDFKHLGPFCLDIPLGNNVYRLILPKDLSQLHPIFHTLLLLPFINPSSYPARLGLRSLRGPASLTEDFWDEKDMEAFLGYTAKGVVSVTTPRG